jgi:2-polyprenyl-3-methyl-5-hydroxy-6-metoxy-1,4-benzoquinol methylase
MSICLFCNSRDSSSSYYPEFIFNEKKFQYRKCNDCQLVYISPLLNENDLGKLYSLDYHDEFYFNSGKTYDNQVKLLKKFRTEGRLLDYGCGDASFLRYFKNRGYELSGAEYNPSLVSKLKELNPEINFITINSLLNDNDQRFDIIHMGDVLEHLTNPREIIMQLQKKLSHGGILFIEGPIEHNFHLAYPTRAIYFKIRKLLQPSRKVNMQPFHVFFSNKKNQLNFFQNLQNDTLYYKIFEWAWPYPDSWKTATSLKLKFEWLVAKISVASSHIINQWGNRFYYIGSPTIQPDRN